MTISDRIHAARVERRMLIADMARELRIDEYTAALMDAGRTDLVPESIVERAARYFGIEEEK